MEALPQAFLDIASTASIQQMEAMLHFLQSKIQKPKTPKMDKNVTITKNNISNFVTFIPDFDVDKPLLDRLGSDAKKLDLTSSATKVQTQWLNSSSNPYTYGPAGLEKSYEPKLISVFPAICELMEMVNASSESTHNMNSCLVSCFNSAESNLRLHADDECDQIDQSSSICTFSLGATRTMDFCSKKARTRKPVPIKSYELKQGCLTIMKPGCQEVLTHRTNNGEHSDGASHIRYSLSFRNYHLKSAENVLLSSPPADSEGVKPDTVHKSNVILIAGDSFTARLDSEKLGKRKKRVVNISQGGNTIKQVQKSLEDYALENSNVTVQKLLLCVGTNDLLRAQQGVKHLKRPYIDMLKVAKTLFPSAKIYCQSMLPLPIFKRNTAVNVNNMNYLIYEACTQQRVYYLDVFENFLNDFGFRSELLFPRTIKDIHPDKRGIGVLAKFYIHLIHSKTFNPLGY